MRTLLAALASVALAFAQPASPTFEVASVKPASPPTPGKRTPIFATGGPGSNDPGRFTAHNATLATLIIQAYDIKYFQLLGLDPVAGPRFDVSAKVPPGATKAQFRQMLQNLLADRFSLKLHRETRQMPVYELTVARNGPKFKESTPDPPKDPADPPASRAFGPATLDKDGFPVLPPGNESMMISMPGKAIMRAHAETMEQLANKLSGQLGLPVTDATNLKGKYDYILYWAFELPPGMPSPQPAPDPAQDAGPTIFAAVQQQLGLKLESKKGPVEILVVDHAERMPTQN